MQEKVVDVAIIGAGSAGLSARREVAKVTDNYVVLDHGILGTTCARVGCMPSKVLIQVAEDYHRRLKWEEEGIAEGAILDEVTKLKVNPVKVMQHVRKLRDRFVRGVTGGMSSWMDDEHFIAEKAYIKDGHHLKTENYQIFFKKLIVAVGTKPFVPPVLSDIPQEYLVNTDSFFEMEKLLESVAVVGLGVIGIELGLSLARLGVDTYGIARRRNIAGVTDPELNNYVTQKYSEQMNLFFEGIEEAKVVEGKVQLTLKREGKAETIMVEKVLVTAGRRVNFDDLGLCNTTAQFKENDFPLVHPETFQVMGAEHIFLTGDATGAKQILHEASDEGKIAGFNSVNPTQKFQTRVPLTITFSDPNIALVGKSYSELFESGAQFEVGQVSFEGQGRSIVKLKEIGMLRIYGETSTGKILGAELFGPDGEHLAHLISWAMSAKLTVFEVLSYPFYHPVVEEGLRTALRDLASKIEAQSPSPLEVMKK